ncbi:hypothetical protein [Salinibius halmophilus]|uniref:hypothetical protein n=1 Tax=Salinibius halmophilus TaxID=1853216 RepID=UPI000E676488|nr:hypothetical protein [Salinibius halmophilus]
MNKRIVAPLWVVVFGLAGCTETVSNENRVTPNVLPSPSPSVIFDEFGYTDLNVRAYQTYASLSYQQVSPEQQFCYRKHNATFTCNTLERSGPFNEPLALVVMEDGLPVKRDYDLVERTFGYANNQRVASATYYLNNEEVVSYRGVSQPVEVQEFFALSGTVVLPNENRCDVVCQLGRYRAVSDLSFGHGSEAVLLTYQMPIPNNMAQKARLASGSCTQPNCPTNQSVINELTTASIHCTEHDSCVLNFNNGRVTTKTGELIGTVELSREQFGALDGFVISSNPHTKLQYYGHTGVSHETDAYQVQWWALYRDGAWRQIEGYYANSLAFEDIKRAFRDAVETLYQVE